jgi:hypothetical protein
MYGLEALIDCILEALLQAGLPALDVFWGGGDLVSLCIFVRP